MSDKDDPVRRPISRFSWEPGDIEIVRAQVVTSSWSEEAKEATRAGLDFGATLAATGEQIAFKNHDGRFALLSEADLAERRFCLFDRKTGVVSAFADVGALIEAGWVFD